MRGKIDDGCLKPIYLGVSMVVIWQARLCGTVSTETHRTAYANVLPLFLKKNKQEETRHKL